MPHLSETRFEQLKYILTNNSRFSDEETTFFILRPEFNRLNIPINRYISNKIFRLIQLYKKISEIYKDPECVSKFLRETKRSILQDKRENFEGFPHAETFKDFYNLYFELLEIL